MIWTLALLFLIVGAGHAWRSDYVGNIEPRSLTHWGYWGHIEWCPAGHYAYGFRIKVEAHMGWRTLKDDSALNGVGLHCKNGRGATGHDIQSTVGPWGTWGHSKYCPGKSFLIGAAILSEPYQGNGDDTAANNFRFTCEHGTSRTGDVAKPFGSWSQRENCPGKSVICGVKTKVERNQGRGDDTALNSAVFYCCRKPGSSG